MQVSRLGEDSADMADADHIPKAVNEVPALSALTFVNSRLFGKIVAER